MIYLDYAANTPPDAAVLEIFCNTEQRFWGNPNATHCAGQTAGQELARITESIATLLHVQPSEIIYTSGASESNNLAIKGLAQANQHIGKHILSTPLEHSSVSGSLQALEKLGYEVDYLDIQQDGTVDLAQLAQKLRSDTVLLAICAVDSELGTVQPIADIVNLLRQYPQCKLHVDATQAVGKTELVWAGVDTMSLSPHKFYGLNGSGLLLKRQSVTIEPQIHGGSSVTPYRSGTPTLALAAATEMALRLAMTQQEARMKSVQHLHQQLRTFLTNYPAVSINSPQAGVPHILNLSVQGVKGTVFQQALSQRDVCVSVKSACSTDGSPSKAVLAVSHDRRNALSSWRISLSHLTTTEELQAFFECFDASYHQLVKKPKL